MVFKINVSEKGKTYKAETENEALIGKKIGEELKGDNVSENLKGYLLRITGTGDITGTPGLSNVEGDRPVRKLLIRGKGMKDTGKGLRLRKRVRGNEISNKTIQVNTIVVKEGSNKFLTLLTPKEETKE